MLCLQFEHDTTIWNKGLLKPAVCPMVDWVHYGSSQVASHISWFDEQHHPAVRIYLSNEQNLSVKMPLKLGSNWKSVGIGTDMRRLAPGNSRVTRLAWFEHKWHKIPHLYRSTSVSAKAMIILEEGKERSWTISWKAWGNKWPWKCTDWRTLRGWGWSWEKTGGGKSGREQSGEEGQADI